jgi:hypothetical protein
MNRQEPGDARGSASPARASYWKRGCAGLALTGLLLGATLTCARGITDGWRGTRSPPWFVQSFGPLRMVGYSTWNAQCPPYVGCAPTRNESYVVWLIWQPAGQSQETFQLSSVGIR